MTSPDAPKVKERPIPFSAPMVRALLAGTKTQTRRVVKPQPQQYPAMRPEPRDGARWVFMAHSDRPTYSFATGDVRCPYGVPGDRLWVREAWRVAAVHDHVPGSELGFGTPPQVQYEAIGDGRDETRVQWGRYRHARFMPRWASRITLEVTGVRVERLQDISEADALAEGIVPGYGGFGLADGSHFHAADPRQSYFSLWEAINGPGSVEVDPWVWGVEFRRLS